MYIVKDGKEHIAVNGVVLGDASQKELKALYDMTHPYILKEAKKAKEAEKVKEVRKKSDDKKGK